MGVLHTGVMNILVDNMAGDIRVVGGGGGGGGFESGVLGRREDGDDEIEKESQEVKIIK